MSERIIKMRRPFIVIGATSLVTMAVVLFSGSYAGVVIAIAATVFSVIAGVFIKVKTARNIMLTVFISAAVFALLGAARVELKCYPVLRALGKEVAVSGTVTETDYSDGTKRFKVISDGGGDMPSGTKINVYSYNVPDVSLYDNVTCRVKLYAANKANANISDITESNGISVNGFLKNIENTAAGNGIYVSLMRFRDKMYDNIKSILPKYQGDIVAEMTLGIRNSSYEIKEEFINSGISHVLAVSGMHLSVVAGAIYFLLSALGFKKRRSSWIIIAGVWVYTVIVGFQIGAVRSAIMLTTAMAANGLGYESEEFNSIGLAAAVIMIFDPESVLSVSFYLSFSATVGIFLLSEKISDKIVYSTRKLPFEKIRKALIGVFAASVSAIMFTVPITVIFFERMQSYALITNLITAPFVPVIIIFGILSELLAFVPFLHFIAEAFGFIAGITAALVEWIAGIFSRLPYSGIFVGYGYIKIWVASFSIIFLILMILKKRKEHFRYAAIISVIVLAAGILSYGISMNGVTKITVSGLDKSVGMIVESENRGVGISTLRSSGDAYYLSRNLKGENVDDAVIALGKEKETYKLTQYGKYDKIFVKTELADNEKLIKNCDGELIGIESGMKITVGSAEIKEISNGVWMIEADGIKILYISEKYDILNMSDTVDADLVIFDAVMPKNAERLKNGIAVYYNLHDNVLINMENLLIENGNNIEFYINNGKIKKASGGLYDIFG